MKSIIATLVIGITLCSCATTKSNIFKNYVSNDKDKLLLTITKNSGVSVPEDQYQLIESQIRDGLNNHGLLSTDNKTGHSVVVTLQSFRMRDDAARLAVGILSGCDNIVSDVSVIDKSTHEEIGNAKISIKECAAWGVASQVIKKYTDGVVAYLSNGKED